MSENLIIAFIGAGGVILGTIITLLGGMWQSYLQSKREYKQHLREKREDVYKEACNVLMKEEEFIRKNFDLKKVAILFNKLQPKIMLYASKNIQDEYYNIGNNIKKLYSKTKSKNKDKISEQIADLIMSLNDKMRKELNIKD